MSWCEASHYGRPSPSALVGTIRTQFMFFFTPSDKKKTGFRVLSKLCCFIKHFSFFFIFRTQSQKRRRRRYIIQPRRQSVLLPFFLSFFFCFLLLHFHFERCRLQLTTRSVQFVQFSGRLFIYFFFSFRLSSRLLFYFIRLPSPFLLRFVIFLLNTPPYKLISLQLI